MEKPLPFFAKHAVTQSTVPAGSARRLVITLDFPSIDNMAVDFSRPVNPIELGLICMQLASDAMQKLAQAQMQAQNRPDSRKPHDYDVNQASASSVRGAACGVCGQAREHDIHPFTEGGI